MEITPPWPVPIASGGGHSTQPFKEVADPLEANVVLLEQGRERVIILQIDCLVVGNAVRQAVRHAAGNALQDDQLFLCASHTHFGPGTDSAQPLLGVVDPAYVEWLADRVGTVIRSLLTGPARPVRLRYGSADLQGVSINRRLKRWRIGRTAPFVTHRVMAAPNPAGEVDQRLRAIRLDALDGGETVAVLWSFACHPVCFPFSDRISAEYPGVVRAALRREFGRSPIVFFNGFAGDVRPPAVRKTAGAAGRVREVLAGARFDRWSLEEWQSWANGIARSAVSIVDETDSRVADLKVRRMEVPLRRLAPAATDGASFSLHRVSLAAGTMILGVSAEPVASYVRRAIAATGARELLPVGYIDSTFGYLPDAAAAREGGYEGRGGEGSYVALGEFAPDVEDQASRLFAEVAKTAAR